MWKWIIIGLAVFALYKLMTNDKTRKVKDESKAKERKIASGELVKDPVCGAYVESDGSISVRDGNTVHRFCSYDCRKRFLEQLQEEGREVPQLAGKDKEDD